MRLFLLTALTMAAFAANSILNRLAVGAGEADPGGFAIVRVLSGAVILAALILWQRKSIPLWERRRWTGAGALTLYLVAFSMAYVTLDAGLGALILFGVVQITMFAVGAFRSVPAKIQWLGAGIALIGLATVVWPMGPLRVDWIGAVLMAAAGFGWGVYSLAGRGEPDALAGTAANFLVAVPFTIAAIFASGLGINISVPGFGLAVISGAVTSGLGYALWYRVLPELAPSVAATVQLSVPVIAILAGAALLGEAVGIRAMIGAVLVLGGIGLSIASRRPG